MPVPSRSRTREQAVIAANPGDPTAYTGDLTANPGEPTASSPGDQNDAIPAVNIPLPRGAPNEQFA